MIDSHTHLFLCDGAEADVVAAAAEAGVGRMLTVGLDAETNAAAIAAAERHEAVFAAVGRHPNEATGFDDETAAEIARLGGPREGAGDRRDRARLLPRHRGPGRPAPRLRRPDRDRHRARPADRDPRPRPRRRQRRGRRDLRHPRRQGRRPPGDPALLLGPRAGRRRDRARLALLLRRQRHLPEREGAALRRRQGPRATCSWSRPTPPTSRRSALRGKRNEPANVVATAKVARRRARRLLRGAGAHGRGQRRARSSAGSQPWSASARTSSPTPTCSTRSSATRSWRRRRRARGRRRRRGADRAPGRRRGARPHGRDRPRPGAGAGADRRAAQRQPALGRRDEDRLRRLRAGADGDGRQPALLGGDAGDPAHDRAAALAAALDRDGAAGDRRPPAGGARQPHLRLAERGRPARLRGRAGAQGRPRRVQAAAAGRLGDPRACAGPGPPPTRRPATSSAPPSPTAASPSPARSSTAPGLARRRRGRPWPSSGWPRTRAPRRSRRRSSPPCPRSSSPTPDQLPPRCSSTPPPSSTSASTSGRAARTACTSSARCSSRWRWPT